MRVLASYVQLPDTGAVQQESLISSEIVTFSTNGFEVTPMDAISAAANVAKGTLSYNFDSKEGIVNAIVERDAVAVEARLASIETDLKLGFVDKFTASVGDMTELIVASYLKLHRMKYIIYSRYQYQAIRLSSI